MAWAYFFGDKVNEDTSKYLEYMEQAARQGLPEAEYEMGVANISGLAGKVDYDQAQQWFSKALAHGYADAGMFLGTMYEEGIGVEVDSKKSQDYYVQARDLYEKEADPAKRFQLNYKLWVMYTYGIGVEPDADKAKSWLDKAPELYDVLDDMCVSGSCMGGTVRDPVTGRDKFTIRNYRTVKDDDGNERFVSTEDLKKENMTRLANLGDGRALLNFGRDYLLGKDVRQNLAWAFSYIRRAAVNEDPFGETMLGLFYGDPESMEKSDYTKSAQWLWKAAGTGFFLANDHLAKLYEDGRGVARDDKMAKLLRNRAEHLQVKAPDADQRAPYEKPHFSLDLVPAN